MPLARAVSCSPVFFTGTATSELYTLSLHDALPIYAGMYGIIRETHLAESLAGVLVAGASARTYPAIVYGYSGIVNRSEEHTSELQSLRHLVCRLLLEKKKRLVLTAQHCHPCHARGR